MSAETTDSDERIRALEAEVAALRAQLAETTPPRRSPIAGEFPPGVDEKRLFFNGPVVVFVWEPVGQWPIRYVTPNVKELFGYEASELIASGFEYGRLIHPDEIGPISMEYWQIMKSDAGHHDVRYRAKRADGTYAYVHEYDVFHRDADGNIDLIIGYIVDVTQGENAERARRNAEQRIQLILRASNDGWWDYDLVTGEIFYSPRWFSQLGLEDENLQGDYRAFFDRIHPDDVAYCLEAQEEAFRSGVEDFTVEFRLLHRDGKYRWVRSKIHITFDKDGAPRRLSGANVDVTAERESEEKILMGRSLLEFIFEKVIAGHWDWNLENGDIYYSVAYKKAFGYEDHEVANNLDGLRQLLHPDDFEYTLKCLDAHIRSKGRIPFREELRYLHKNGSVVWILCTGCVVSWSLDGKALRMVGCHVDITARKEAEAAVQESYHDAVRNTQLLEAAGRIANVGTWEFFLDGRPLEWSETTYRIHDLPIGHRVTLSEAVNFYHPDEKEMVSRIIKEAINEQAPFDFESRLLTAKGNIRWVMARGEPVFSDDGRLISFRGVIQDIDNYRKALDELKNRDALFSALNAHVPGVIYEYVLYPDGRHEFTFLSDWAEELWGFTKEEVMNDPNVIYSRIIDVEEMIKATNESATNLTPFLAVRQYDHPKKGMIWSRAESTPRRGAEGEIRWYGYASDITDAKKAEEQRLQTERQTLQSQKLESLGVLAGGIAHDFNNMLSAILANLELAFDDLSDGDMAVRDSINKAAITARRAADLTRQILAYSGRGHFIIEPIDLNAVIAENAAMIRATIPHTIELVVEEAPELPLIKADIGQIQQIVLNLLTNASDAISGHGMIHLRTRFSSFTDAYLSTSRVQKKPPAGEYVVLEVEDSGQGMSSETMARLFEPFFSTKAAGRGLGLSALLGIVAGHQGAVFVDSVVGKGTCVRVIFPPCECGNETKKPVGLSQRTPLTITPKTPHSGDERVRGILIIDDEESILSFCAKAARRAGYHVYTANNGETGVSLATENRDAIDIVIVDLTMPNKNGIETLRELKEILPNSRRVLMSGYGKKAIDENLANLGVSMFLQKPFRLEEFLESLKA